MLVRAESERGGRGPCNGQGLDKTAAVATATAAAATVRCRRRHNYAPPPVDVTIAIVKARTSVGETGHSPNRPTTESPCDTQSNAPQVWPNNYGVWMDEMVPLGFEDCVDALWPQSAVVFDSENSLTLDRPYGRVNRKVITLRADMFCHDR